MRRTLATTGIVAAGLAALAVSVTPAIAAQGAWGPGDGTCTGSTASTGSAWGGMGGGFADGTGTGMGARRGMQGQGYGMGAGMGAGRGGGFANLEKGTLTSTQKTTLAAMAEEEKMAHDLYVALGEQYPDLYQFSRVAQAESRHLSMVRALLERYGLDDPTAGQAAGEFQSATFQGLYDQLLAGATTEAKALAAGVTVERTDIGDLADALSGLTAPDVEQVYTNLRNASEHHLAAFGG